ncbi:hypothetical protein QBC44DRAFT_311904 [Cladorrhinum sp. PSN332]|nr:hypothetical protein QBC44DRAFT_311904 [Cladorrhinum sp. PSN332]
MDSHLQFRQANAAPTQANAASHGRTPPLESPGCIYGLHQDLRGTSSHEPPQNIQCYRKLGQYQRPRRCAIAIANWALPDRNSWGNKLAKEAYRPAEAVGFGCTVLLEGPGVMTTSVRPRVRPPWLLAPLAVGFSTSSSRPSGNNIPIRSGGCCGQQQHLDLALSGRRDHCGNRWSRRNQATAPSSVEESGLMGNEVDRISAARQLMAMGLSFIVETRCTGHAE